MTNMTSVSVDNSAYTLSCLTLDPSTGTIYSVSPGLFGETAWTLVTVDPVSGAVAAVGRISPPGTLQSWYGGGVYGAGVTQQKTMFHLFKRVGWETNLAS
jgi:hypothetical protein